MLALEHDDAMSLPGGAYTAGFLRTYAAYLGLDGDAAVVDWERQHRDVRAVRRFRVRQPIRTARRTLVLSPALVRPALFLVVFTAFAVYLGVQLLRVAKPPALTILEPATAVTTLDATATSYVLRGATTPQAIVSIATPGREQPYRIAAGGDGLWTVRVELRRGANLFDVDARDPATGKTADRKAQLFITVPFVVATDPALRLDQPTDGAILDRGSVAVQGVAHNADRVAVTASRMHEAITDVSVHVAADGFFTTSLELRPGTWRLEVTAIASDGRLVSVRRDIVVALAPPAR